MASALIYTYTILVILVCFAAAMLSVAAYTVSHKNYFVVQAVFFVLYIIETASILGAEFVSQNIPFSPDAYYEITMPALRIITSAGILQCLWLMLRDVLDVHDVLLTYVPVIVFVILSMVVVGTLPYGAVRQWVYYTLRQLFIAFGLAYAYWCWKRSPDTHYRNRLERYRAKYIFLWVLLVMILLEDAYVILVAPIPSAENDWLTLYLSERNFSENLMMLFVAYHSIRSSLSSLALRFVAPPSASSDAPAAADLVRHIDDQLPAFVAEHGLSGREAEVLRLLLEGVDNRRIGQQLYLSEGTIKTHVHNIMRKTNTATRDELKQSFWAS